jgi:acetyl esterase/lipase
MQHQADFPTLQGAYKPDFASPIFSPFSVVSGHGKIPPTYIQACGLDMVRDDALIYEKMLREDRCVATRVDLYLGLPHHFWEFFPQLTDHIQQRMDDTVAGMNWLLETAGSVER